MGFYRVVILNKLNEADMALFTAADRPSVCIIPDHTVVRVGNNRYNAGYKIFANVYLYLNNAGWLIVDAHHVVRRS